MQDFSIIEQELSHLRKGVLKLMARKVKKDPTLLMLMFDYLSVGKMPLVWRAANVLKIIARTASKYIKPHLPKVYDALEKRKDIDALSGIFFKIITHCKADLSEHAHVLDIAIEHILKPSEIGYNRGYGLQLLELALNQFEELADEFQLIVDQIKEDCDKAYVLNCAVRLEKKIKKIKSRAQV